MNIPLHDKPIVSPPNSMPHVIEYLKLPISIQISIQHLYQHLIIQTTMIIQPLNKESSKKLSPNQHTIKLPISILLAYEQHLYGATL